MNRKILPALMLIAAAGTAAAQTVELAALKTDHHAGGYTGQAHQHREGGRVVLAEAAPGLEQKPIDRVTLQFAWRQRVNERLLVIIIECPMHQLKRLRRVGVVQPAGHQLPDPG